MRREDRRDRWLGWAILALVATVYVVRLGDPPGDRRKPNAPTFYLYDECYTVFSAHRITLGDPELWNPGASREDAVEITREDLTHAYGYEWTHPPLAKLVMAGLIEVFGFRAEAYRMGGVLCGLVSMLLVWRLAIRMRGARFGLVVLGLLATDGLFFVMSRVGMTDIYPVVFITGALYCLYRYWVEPTRRLRWLLGTGLAFGLGIAAKWTAGPLAIGCALLCAGRVVYDGFVARELSQREVVRHGLAWVAAFVAIPSVVYVASYAPMFALGYGFDDFAALQSVMWNMHHHLVVTGDQISPWYEWPLMTNPVWIYQDLPRHSRLAREIYAGGNPLLWWPFLPAILWVGVRWLRRREVADALILVGFFGVWLPWAFVSRAGYMQYFIGAVPFGVLAIATGLRDLAPRFGGRGRWLTLGYAVLCVAAFAWFYPIWSGLPVDKATLHGAHWFWFEQWR